MLNFTQWNLLFEEANRGGSKFGAEDWSKHGYRYSLAVINDLLDDKPVTVHASAVQSLGDQVTIKDFDRSKLVELKKKITDGQAPTADQFQAAITNPNIKRKLWSNLAKWKYTGSDQKFSDDSGEIGFLFAVDMLIHHHDFVSFSQYKPSELVKCADKQTLNKALKQMAELSEQDPWVKTQRNSAKLITKRYPEILQGNYEMHHKTEMYNRIREQGQKLSGLAKDKWNPADMIFVKKGTVLDPKQMKTLVNLNSYIGNMETFIPVSLKKNTDAIQGAVAVSTYLQNAGLKPLTKIANNQQAVKAIKDYVIKIANNPKLSSIVKIGPIKDDFIKYFESDEQSKNFVPSSESFKNALPPALEFLLRATSGQQSTAESVMRGAYVIATSSTPSSCNHWKAMGTKLKFVNCETSVDFKLEDIIIPMNGTSRIYFNLSVREVGNDGRSGEWEHASIECRSKRVNSFPDFNVVYRHKDTANAMMIKDFVHKYFDN